MLVRCRVILLAAVTAALSAVVVAPVADAASAVRFGKIQYDSPGSDTGSNSSLNAEWVRVVNHASTKRVLSGWTLRDAQNHVYMFPTFTLGAGHAVRVHTGHGTNSGTDLYWRSSSYIWNNTGDKATLKNKAGTDIDTCKWGDGPGYLYC